ncbi:MAG: NusG domain II-containing protein [Oscillospiraceae bacterium]|nr:NusG domain II-containing protein [Oscillospiraceae bacterium]
MKLLNKRNIVYTCVIFALFAGCVAAWFFIRNSEVEEAFAVIYKNSEQVQSVDLSSETSEYQISVGSAETGINIILIKDGAIGVISADCPDQICVHTGFIKNRIVPVVCLPNKLEIRIVSGDKVHGVFDAVAR